MFSIEMFCSQVWRWRQQHEMGLKRELPGRLFLIYPETKDWSFTCLNLNINICLNILSYFSSYSTLKMYQWICCCDCGANTTLLSVECGGVCSLCSVCRVAPRMINVRQSKKVRGNGFNWFQRDGPRARPCREYSYDTKKHKRRSSFKTKTKQDSGTSLILVSCKDQDRFRDGGEHYQRQRYRRSNQRSLRGPHCTYSSCKEWSCCCRSFRKGTARLTQALQCQRVSGNGENLSRFPVIFDRSMATDSYVTLCLCW